MRRATFRDKTDADVDALFDLWQRSVAATHDFVSAEDKARIGELVRQQYLPNADLTVACDDTGRILAFMGMSDNVIDALFVDPDVRGTGVGRQFIERAREAWPDALIVEVNEQNVQAVGFYQHMGFATVSRLPRDHEGKPYPLLVMAWPRRKGNPPERRRDFRHEVPETDSGTGS